MYVNFLRLLLKFDNEYLLETISSTNMFVNDDETSPSNSIGGQQASVLEGGEGYIMQDGQYLLGDGISGNGYDLNIHNGAVIGFWLYPSNSGMATNPSTGDAEPITMPLLNFVNSSTGSSVIKIKEYTYYNSANYMTVFINNTQYQVTSEVYDSGKWHYVWIAYNGTTGNLIIYIDGRNQTSSNSGSLVSSFGGTHMDLYINYSDEGYAYNIGKNYGYIDDLFVLNEYNTVPSDIQKVINNGIDYLVDTGLRDTIIDGYNIYFDDPSTITITSAIDDMSYLYIGRNDGKILRGSPLLWEVRKTYSDKEEENLLNIDATKTSNNKISDDGFLEIKSTTIRL